MTGRRVVTVAAVVLAATIASAPVASADPPNEPIGAHVSECARAALGQRVDPPAVTCSHDGHLHSFATFGELVAHLRAHHGELD